MDAIKKKMQSLKSETDNSLARAEQLDTEAKEANALAEKTEEHVSVKIIYRHFSGNTLLFIVIFLFIIHYSFCFSLGSRSSKEDATCRE